MVPSMVPSDAMSGDVESQRLHWTDGLAGTSLLDGNTLRSSSEPAGENREQMVPARADRRRHLCGVGAGCKLRRRPETRRPLAALACCAKTIFLAPEAIVCVSERRHLLPDGALGTRLWPECVRDDFQHCEACFTWEAVPCQLCFQPFLQCRRCIDVHVAASPLAAFPERRL